MKKVCHLTTVHARTDTRIFHKMCASLSSGGYDVTLVVADGLGNEKLSGVSIIDAGKSKNRRERVLKAPQRVFELAVKQNSDLYHLHDPELLPIGLKLSRMGKRVVFDSHEDVPKQLLGKPYFNKPILWFLSKAFGAYEAWVCRRLSGVIAATPYIREKFLRYNPQTLDINNFPLPNELVSDVPWDLKKNEVCYIGGIAKVRGIHELVRALDLAKSDVRLNICGNFNDSVLKSAIKAQPGWRKFNEHGFVDRAGVRAVLGRSVAGLVTLHPIVNYLDALPVKMFEYMAAGIPPIASNFPLWREIIEGNDCGICVDPLDPKAIADAIDYFLENPDQARRMGANGVQAVKEKYNWALEEIKLFGYYEQILQ
ncbi:glycosyltransferase family 4 protein [Variovorax sp. RB3P1]|uniref:glycosyltransferase family 4 protein n=1 Tax=Variovorax sp. RB3P1 TaxID=3443732 RepID=UPI003F486CC8